MRNARDDARKVFVVLPDGRVTATYVAIGVESPYVSYEEYGDDLVASLKPEARRFGVRLLEDLYDAEEDDEIRTRGPEVFAAWWAGKYGTGKNAASVDQWLPASVRQLRDRHLLAEVEAAQAMPSPSSSSSSSNSSTSSSKRK